MKECCWLLVQLSSLDCNVENDDSLDDGLDEILVMRRLLHERR